VPAKFRTCEALVPAYEEVLKDGGIGRLRRVILGDVAEVVQREVQAVVRGRLAELRQRFRNRLESVLEGQDMAPDDLVRAARWGAAIGRYVIEPVRRDPRMYQEPARVLKHEMKRYLAEVVLDDLTEDEAPLKHQGYCGALYNLAMNQAGAQAEAMYAQAEALFRQVVAGQPLAAAVGGNGDRHPLEPLRSGDPQHRDPLAWWVAQVREERALLKDRAMKAWYAPVFQKIRQPDLEFQLDEAVFPAVDYRKLMERKIDALVYAWVTDVLEHLAGTIDPIRKTMAALGANPAHLNPIPPQDIDDLLGDLG
jgi:hypothetical protein